MLKKLLVCASFLVSMQSMAGGPLDGIYSCGISAVGKNVQAYVTINGHPDGTTIYVPAAVSPTNDVHGYGMGTATATSFVGNTMYGLPFNFSVNPATGILSGTAGINVSGTNVTGTVNCLKIW
jgi:hypothetical protein